jgi:hypothetical protein
MSSELQRPNRLTAGLARQAETADGFTHVHGKRGDGFKALNAGIRRPRTILAAHFGEKQLGVAKNTGQGVIEFVKEDVRRPRSEDSSGRTNDEDRFIGNSCVSHMRVPEQKKHAMVPKAKI